MANNQFTFTGSAYPFNEDPVFHNSPYTRSEDNLADASMNYIDPSLQSPSAPSDPYLGHWDHQQPQQHQFGLQKYLEDNQKTALFNISDMPSKMTANRAMMRPAAGIPPVPPASHPQVRFASPISSEGPSSSSDNMHSPPTDTDSHYESFGSPAADPATLSLPFAQQAPYDWSAVQFMGMGINRDVYVNPIDVNPTQQPAVDYLDDNNSNVEFTLPTRMDSYESYTSNNQCEMEPLNNTAAIDLPVRRLASPEPIQLTVKEEINASSYPPPPRRSHDPESEESDAEPPAPKRRKSNDDDDYDNKPKKKPARRQSRRSPKSQPSTVTTISPPPNPRTNKPASGLNPSAKALPPPPTTGKPIYSCPDCSHTPFKDQTNLDNHIKKQHTRPFICVFHFAGCESTFASKNEWKRHVASQHILLNYWLCDEGPCAGAPGKSSSSSSPGASTHNDFGNATTTTTTTNGVIFNRKDLYTQHVRRMHMPPQIKKVMKAGTTSSSTKDTPASTSHPEWETRIKEFQSRAMKERCQLPLMMACPVAGCDAQFHGPDSWDQRMEHVARHLERAAQGNEGPVVFGGVGDRTLVEWACSEAVGIIKKDTGGGSEWELNPLLKRGGNNGAYSVQQHQGLGRGIVVLGGDGRGRKESGREKGGGGRGRSLRGVATSSSNVKRDEEIKNEIVVSEPEEDERRNGGEIVVYDVDDDLRDAEGEEEDD